MELLIVKTIHAHNGHIHTTHIAHVVQVLRSLQPGKPEDGTQGFIAYNVPGKDRMKMKTGRFLTRKLGLQTVLPDTVIQRLASEINTVLFPGFGVRLDTGDDIQENYRDEIGGGSCMTGGCASYVGLYVDNPTRFSQLIIEQNGDSARAMVFHLDSGDTMLGRVYATCEYLKGQIRDYAEQQGWLPNGSNGAISGLDYTDGEIPYMDSLKEYRIEDGLLTIGNSLPHSQGVLDSQNGELETRTPCQNCNQSVDEDNSYSNDDGETFCESCYYEIYSYCEKCDHTVCRDDIRCIDGDTSWCDSCANHYANKCENCGDYFTDTVTIDDNEYCPNCAESYPICEDCSEHTLKTNDCGCCEDCDGHHIDEIPCNA